MKASQIKELTVEELQDKIAEENLNYTKMRLSHAITPLESPAKLAQTRKIIARLKTELRARELAQ
ncbi:MAG: 50S ribosomal protein L29 [Bacteroidia bacterium]